MPINFQERPLDPSVLRGLVSKNFEIGAHGFSHKPLQGLRNQELEEQIRPCKPILEDTIGKEVQMFCYPFGRYNAKVVRVLQEAGYHGARTVRMLATELAFNPFEMPTTLQVFPHPRLTYLKSVFRGRRVEGVQTYLTQWPRLGNWLELGKWLFDEVLENGGIWHLHGHSWEIERLGLWGNLGEILEYVCHREDVRYLTNCELVQMSKVLPRI